MQSNIAVLPLKKRKYRGFELVPGLQHELFLQMRAGVSFKDISRKCNGSPSVSTISKLAYRETKLPRFATIIALYVALGFTISAEQA